MSGGCVEVLRACRFGFMGGCVKKLKTMGESGVERVGEGLEERGVFGLWWSYGRGFAARWWCGIVERVRR